MAPFLSLEHFINWELGDKYLHHLLSGVSEKGELNVPKQKNPGNFPGPLSPLPISLQAGISRFRNTEVQDHVLPGLCSTAVHTVLVSPIPAILYSPEIS